MIKADELLTALNAIAPFELSCEWDNCGLLVNSGSDIRRVLLCLDVTEPVINEAIEKDIQLILSHHPVIFKPLSRIDYKSPVYKLCKNDISCIAMHTNLDAAKGGVNDLLCDILGLEGCSIFEEVGRIGRFDKPYSITDIALKIHDRLNYYPRYYDCGSEISCVAVLGGAGSVVAQAYNSGAQCLITGELRHSDWLLARQLGISAIEAGHYATEHPIVESLCRRLNLELAGRAEFLVSCAEPEPTILFR